MRWLLATAAIGLIAALAGGCGGVELDTTPTPTDANRAVFGTVELGGDLSLPPNATVVVRVVDQAHRAYRNPNAALGEPTATAAVAQPPQVLGEQKIAHPTGSSVPFRVEFYATDEQLAGGLVLEARVSIGGHVSYYNVDSYAINPANIGDARHIYVNQMQ